MSEPARRGRLIPPAGAPARGESFAELFAAGGVRIEHILSGATEPAGYLQDYDEWVIVLAGGATLEVGGEEIELGPQDWVLLPAHVGHRVLRTAHGTSWLAVHLGGSSPAP